MFNFPMESSELDKLIAARIAFNKLLEGSNIEKDAKGNRGSYLSLEALQDETIKLMNQVGLVISPSQFCQDGKEYLMLTLRHSSGQFERSIGYLHKEEETMDGQLAQVLGAVLTYKTRYMWRTLLGIGRGAEDPEKNEYAHKPSYTPPTKPVQQAISSGLTLQHQNEILRILKSNADAIKMLCVQFKVSKLSEIKDAEYTTVLETAQFVADKLGL